MIQSTSCYIRSVLWAVMTIAASLMILGIYSHFSLMKYPCAVFASLWKEHLSSNLCPIFNEWYVTMYPVSVSIFTDQWLIGPTNPLQSSLGKETWAQGFQHIWSGVLAKFWFQGKRENQWACLGEVISADLWTTWLVFSSILFPHICCHTCIHPHNMKALLRSYFQLFEGECVPDFDRLKVELLKEEVSSP